MWRIFIILVPVVSVAMIVFLQWLGIIPSRYPLTYFDGEKIVLRRRKGLTKTISWDKIAAIFPCRFVSHDMEKYHGFSFECNDGEKINFSIPRNVPEVLNSLYEMFLDKLRKADKEIAVYDFAHPKSWIQAKYNNYRITTLISGISLATIAAIGFLSFRGAGPYLFPIPFLILFILVLIKERRVIYRRQGLISLKVVDDQLVWQNDLRQSEKRNFSEIKKFTLGKNKGCIEFSDGRKLNDLEKVCYWPVLREYLVSKLER